MFASEELLEYMASIVEKSDDYRVLRRLKPFVPQEIHNADFVGVILDTETTGLDPSVDEIIELSLIRFRYSAAGQIAKIEAVLTNTREPSCLIPPLITQLTGLGPEQVVGTDIDRETVEALIADAHLIIAHNAAHDRKFCEVLMPAFASKNWACTYAHVPWPDVSKRLGDLLSARGVFHDGHRGQSDCAAVLFLLAQPVDGQPALAHLLANASREEVRLFATGAPFETRHFLKARGYRWDASKRAWFIDLAPEAVEAEIVLLRSTVLPPWAEPAYVTIDARNRFSSRL